MTDSASMSLWTVLPSSLTYIATVTVGDVYYPFAYTGQTLAFPAARMPVYGQVDVDGTAGQDMVVGTLDYHRYALGEGNDLFITGSGPEWVDMGPGDDLVYLTSNQDFYDVVMLGAGRDLIVPVQTVGAMAASRRHIIKDFQPGPDGDRIAMTYEAARLDPYQGGTIISEFSGGSTNGRGIFLEGVLPAQLTADNFIAFDPRNDLSTWIESVKQRDYPSYMVSSFVSLFQTDPSQAVSWGQSPTPVTSSVSINRFGLLRYDFSGNPVVEPAFNAERHVNLTQGEYSNLGQLMAATELSSDGRSLKLPWWGGAPLPVAGDGLLIPGDRFLARYSPDDPAEAQRVIAESLPAGTVFKILGFEQDAAGATRIEIEAVSANGTPFPLWSHWDELQSLLATGRVRLESALTHLSVSRAHLDLAWDVNVVDPNSDLYRFSTQNDTVFIRDESRLVRSAQPESLWRIDTGAGNDVIIPVVAPVREATNPYSYNETGIQSFYQGAAGTGWGTSMVSAAGALPINLWVPFNPAIVLTKPNGGEGDDTIRHDGSTGHAVMVVGPVGIESVAFSGTDPLILTSADMVWDTVTSGAAVGTMRVQGGSGGDLIETAEGNDTLDGGDGPDLLFGGAGVDELRGGAGIDLLIVKAADRIVDSPGLDLVLWRDRAAGAARPGRVEFSMLDGSFVNANANGSDTLDFSNAPRSVLVLAGDGPDRLLGGAFDDYLFGDGFLSPFLTIPGSDVTGYYEDQIEGGDGHDFLYGGAGSNTISGGLGDDVLLPGNSSLAGYYGTPASQIDGGPGFDVAAMGDSSLPMRVVFDAAAGVITSRFLDMAVFEPYQFPQSSQLRFHYSDVDFRAIEALVAGPQRDLLDFRQATQRVVLAGGGGADTILGSPGDDVLWGDGPEAPSGSGLDADQLARIALAWDAFASTQAAGADSLSGGSGRDTLIGAGGADTLDGGEGQDWLWAAGGNNRLTGGLGADVFTLSVQPGQAMDRILDFGVDDQLCFDGLARIAGRVEGGSDSALGRGRVQATAQDGSTLLSLGLDEVPGGDAFLLLEGLASPLSFVSHLALRGGAIVDVIGLSLPDPAGAVHWKSGAATQFQATDDATAASSLDRSSGVSSADALAALKISLGFNPNPDPDGPGPMTPQAVSPFQQLAADVDGDGVVSRVDAVAILRQSVGRPDAPAPIWRMVEVDPGSPQGWMAVLIGDVDGSWMPH